LDKLTLRTRPDQQTEYRHTALDTTQRQIRLLKVDTRYESNHFIVELFPLESAPSYLALSYTWGKPKPTRRIYVDERRLKVRLNLYQFLRVFAQRHRADYIWVDQISIDQDTAGERNHQVQFMVSLSLPPRLDRVTLSSWLGGVTQDVSFPRGQNIARGLGRTPILLLTSL